MNDTSSIGVNNTGTEVSSGVAPVTTPPVNNDLNSGNVGVQNATPVLASNEVQPQVQAPQVNLDAMVNSAPVVNTVPAVNPTPVVAPVTPVAPVSPTPTIASVQPTINVEPTPVVQSTPITEAPQVVVPPVNLDNMVNSAPITPVEPTPVAAPIPEKNNSKVEINIGDNVVIDDKREEKKVKENREIKTTNNDEDEDEEGNKVSKAPIIIVILFIVILVLLFIYYFLVMTPTKVFDKAINTTIDSVKNLYYGVKDSENKKLDLDLKFDLVTDESVFEGNPRLQNINRLNGDHFESDIKIDLDKENIEVSLKASRKDKKEILDFSVFSIDDYLYVQPRTYYNDNYADAPFKDGEIFSLNNDKIVQADILKTFTGHDTTVSYSGDKIDALIDVAETTKNKILEIIQESQLKRNITFKQIGGATTIALKVNCKVDKEDISKIYYPIFNDYLRDNEILDKIALVSGISRDEVKKYIEDLLARELTTDFVDVNLYMNLANTELVSVDVNVADEYYAQIDYLSGYYSIQFTKYQKSDKNKKVFSIEAMYDSTNGIVEGEGFIDNNDTYIKVLFNYNRVVGTKGNKTGNNLVLKFSPLESGEPFAILNCSLDILTGENADIKELENFVNNDGTLNTKFTKENVYAIPNVKASVVNRTPHFREMTLTEEDIPRTTIELDKLKGEMPLLEAADLLVFQYGFKYHVEFVVDRLLHNKETEAYYEKERNGKKETKEEDTKSEVVEETKTETKTEESETTEQNTTESSNKTTNTTE